MTKTNMLEENPIPYFFRIVYMANNYRDPLLRMFEKDMNLTRPEFSILVCLGIDKSVSATDISEITCQPQNTISRGVLLLMEKGMLKRDKDEKDKRRHRLKLTQKGEKERKKVMTYLEHTDKLMVASLNSHERKQLGRLLTKICRNAIPPLNIM